MLITITPSIKQIKYYVETAINGFETLDAAGAKANALGSLKSLLFYLDQFETVKECPVDLDAGQLSEKQMLLDALKFYGIDILEDGSSMLKPSSMEKWRKGQHNTEVLELRAENERLRQMLGNAASSG